MYGRLITLLVFVMLSLTALTFALNYLWVRMFGPGMPQRAGVPVMQQAQGENDEEQSKREEEHSAKIKEELAKKAQAAEKRAKELPGKRAAWQAQSAAKTAEQKAQDALRMAVDLLNAGRREPALRRLREVVEKYPGTSAAEEADALLKK